MRTLIRFRRRFLFFISLYGRGPKGLSSRRKPLPYGAGGELRRGGYQPPVEIGQRPTSGRVIPAPTQHGPRSPVGTTIGRPQTCAHVRQTDEQCSSLRSGRTSGSSGRRPLRRNAGLRCRGWRPRQPGGKIEKQQKSPANADFDPFSPEISFLYFLAREGP